MYILRKSSVGMGGEDFAGVTFLVSKVVLTLLGTLPPVDFLAVCFGSLLIGGGVAALDGDEEKSEES